MKRNLAMALFCACLMITPAIAQQSNDPATKEDVQKMLEVTGSRQIFDSMMVAMKEQIPALTAETMKKQSPDATPEQMAQLQEFMNLQLEKMFKSMPYDQMMQASIPAYQKHFTHGELQELLQFYSTPLGKKLIAEMPALMTESMQAMTPVIQKWSESAVGDMMRDAEEFAKTLKAQEKQKTAPAPKPKAKPGA